MARSATSWLTRPTAAVPSATTLLLCPVRPSLRRSMARLPARPCAQSSRGRAAQTAARLRRLNRERGGVGDVFLAGVVILQREADAVGAGRQLQVDGLGEGLARQAQRGVGGGDADGGLGWLHRRPGAVAAQSLHG